MVQIGKPRAFSQLFAEALWGLPRSYWASLGLAGPGV